MGGSFYELYFYFEYKLFNVTLNDYSEKKRKILFNLKIKILAFKDFRGEL